MATEQVSRVRREYARNRDRLHSSLNGLNRSLRTGSSPVQAIVEDSTLFVRVRSQYHAGRNTAVFFLDENGISLQPFEDIDFGTPDASARSASFVNDYIARSNAAITTGSNRGLGRRLTGGLSSAQVDTIGDLRDAITSGDRDSARRILRNKLAGPGVRSPLNNWLAGGTASNSQINTALTRYSGSLLNYRTELIARTTALTEFNRGRQETFDEAMRLGLLNEDNYSERWTTTPPNVRDSHQNVRNGGRRNEQGFFELGSGNLALYPGDPSLPLSDRINCKCQIRRSIRRS